ncbi:glutaminyl-peptide cyclotransferase [Sphingobacterium prati]|uniref:glutaminyl-peptide cyclotransferase n=1 Tax=Sphingobacterium prati TaxID=2737006 RepID=UPI0015530639|nr:glutaminyl-peptide cyclotransferase [Sphingobacterium prati]NPE47973.1 glutaminyl-peptide cyclotransferase [Sphingobacterium prati]
MKTTSSLFLPTVASLFIGCGENGKKATSPSPDNLPKNNPSFNFEGIKQDYTTNEELSFQITNTSNLKIDSILYYINDYLIAKVTEINKVAYRLSREKFGKQIVKAVVFHGGKSEENTVNIDYLPSNPPRILKYRIINTYPHDIKAFTQGLEFFGDNLMESTGNGVGVSGSKGKSSIRIVNSTTGQAIKKIELADSIFGEGATILNGKLYQLTYKSNLAYVYDMATLKIIKTLPYFKNMEGWGLTSDRKNLYMSDGSENIYIINPNDFSKIDYIRVATNEKIVNQINEMEWVKGKIYANFFMEDVVGIIDPRTGAIEGLVDLSKLRENVTQHVDLDVLNGIAYNKKSNTFFLTGKNWDKIFEIQLID